MDQFAREVARKVQQQLIKAGPLLRRVRVVADEVAQEGSGGQAVWWYVPVSIHRDLESMAEIYEGLSVAEEQLQEESKLSVLLVPRIIPFQRWSEAV